MLQAAVGRPVVSCRFPSRPIMLHVQAVIHRVKKLRKKASFRHTCAYQFGTHPHVGQAPSCGIPGMEVM